MSDAVVPEAAALRGLAEPSFDSNAMRVLKERYFAKKADGALESPKEFLWRVASAIAEPERPYALQNGRDSDGVVDGVAHAFYDMMVRRDFMPNTPCLVNAGRPLSMLSACFVLPVPDSIEGIFYSVKAMALVQKSGGGCIAGDARVWSTFCGIEPIDVLFARTTADGRPGVAHGSGVAYDVRDLNIRTMSMNPATGASGLRHVTHVWKFDVPADAQIVVRTREGVEVQTSEWHPFMVLRGTQLEEVRADALRAGDVIVGPEAPDALWPWSDYRTVAGLTLDEETAWLAGFTLGDGSFGRWNGGKRLRWFSGTDDVLERVKAVLAKHGARVNRTARDPRGDTKYVTTLNQPFIAAFAALCGLSEPGPKDATIRIPEMIGKSPLSVVHAFIAGLIDSDGTVDADGSVSYSTASEAMAMDLSALVSLLGFQPTVRVKAPHGRGKLPNWNVLLARINRVPELAALIGPFMSAEARKARLGAARGRDAELAGYETDTAALLARIARVGQEIASVTRATSPKAYYDLTVDEWNTYAAGRNGLVMIHNTGFSFSDLRHQGAEVVSTGRDASGPVSFMKVFNAATDSIKQGGVRRGANMGVLRVDHPDIFHFMSCKKELDAENRALWNRLSDTGRYTAEELAHIKQELLQTQINNFNISVGVTDAFMAAVEADGDFELRDPRTGELARTVRARDIWDAIVEGAWQNGEPGVLFLDHPEWNPLPGLGPIHATNPCVTGDTLVAVADGRGHVSIRELAESGKDVPVFCLDDRQKVTVRTMRRPRKTGTDVDVYRVTLDDGSVVRATANHKFRMRNGSYCEVQHLKAGDSLKVMTRFQASLREIFPGANSRSQDYWWVNNSGGVTNRLEHRYIAEFAFGARIPAGHVVHHRDFNAQNNSPDNLQVLTKAEHDQLHARTMVGDANPMRRAAHEWSAEQWAAYRAKHSENNRGERNKRFSGVSNEMLKEAALSLTRRLKRRFSVLEWEVYARENDLPEQFSDWRREHLNGGVRGLAKWAALSLGLEGFTFADPRVLRHFMEALEQGYDAELHGSVLFINKQCEVCHGEFQLPYANREIAYCSRACNTLRINTDPEIHKRRHAARRVYLDKRAGELREKQLEVFTELRAASSSPVLKQTWAAACRERGISAEISRTSSPFRTYAELQEAAALFNHRVVAVERDSQEDVYNGTVDEFHNFFVGGFRSETASGKARLTYLSSKQCGEQSLHGWDSCNLGSINVGHFYDARAKDVDWERLAQTTALAIRFLDNVIDANAYPLDEIANMVRGNRRVGLGIMGFADLLIQLEVAYGSPEAVTFAAKLMKFIQGRAIETSEQLARERGDFPNKHLSVWKDDPRPRRNAALLSIAPTGTISMIAGCSFGCEPYFGMAYTKHVMKDAEGRPQHLYYVVPLFEEIAKDEGFFSDELLGRIEENRGSLKSLPGVPAHWQDVFTVAADVSVDQHIDMLAAFQKNTCNAVSKCVAAGTLIPTDKGLVPIEAMGEAAEGEFGSLADDYRVVGHDGRSHRVTGFYRNGRVPTVRIRTSNGATLEASRTHHVLTLEGWKAMSDLQVDDLIVGRFEESSGAGGASIATESYTVRPWANPIELPDRMSVDLARWLGMLAADGHAVGATGCVGISEKDPSGDVAREFDALCERVFRRTPKVVVDKRTGVRSRHLTSRALARYVADLIGHAADRKRVPEQVLRGSFGEKVAFLGGLTLDGYLTRDTLVLYAGISKELADGAEALARSLGLPSCYRWTERRREDDLVHQVRVFGDLQRAIDPVEQRKRSLSPAGSRVRLVRTPESVFAMTLPHADSEFSNLRSLKERKPSACLAQTLEKLGVPLADSREYLVRVQQIEAGEAETFDIEVEDAHSYVVNGLVSHNTINAPNDDTRENVARAIFRAYRGGCKGFTYYRDGSRTEQVVTFSKDGDLKGGNRDVAASEPAATEAAVAPVITTGTNDVDIDALLAKANALLEVR